MSMERFERIGMVARWKPLHLGHAAVLRGLGRHAARVLVGIGSANRYDARNPFTAEESAEMIRLVLPEGCRFELIEVPDLNDGPRWSSMVRERFGELDLFVTDNPYVRSLLQDDYLIVPPVRFVPEEERVPIDGTMVRREMARGEGWRDLVPPAVASYIIEHKLDHRFRKEFGLETLAREAPD